jgi:hypothetical protein
MNFDHAIEEIDDPIVRDSTPSVDGCFPPTRETQARVGDLDHESGKPRMRVDIVARRTANHADVRLWLGPVAEEAGTLDLNEPSVSENAVQCSCDEQYRGPMQARLRLRDEQEPVDQLDRVVLVEKAVVGQPFVFVAGPAMHHGPDLPHEAEPTHVHNRRSTCLEVDAYSTLVELTHCCPPPRVPPTAELSWS